LKTAILYHQVKPSVDCPDGFAAAWVAYNYLSKQGTEIDLFGCAYTEPAPDLTDYQQIYIVDFSFPRSVIDGWNDKDVILIDHHKTAQEHLLGDVSNFHSTFQRVGKNFIAVFDMQECGATLAWKHFFPEVPIPAFLYYVRDRDLWNWQLPESKQINEALANLRYKIGSTAKSIDLSAYELTFKLFDLLSELSQEELVTKLLPLGKSLLVEKELQVEAAAKRYQLRYLPEPAPTDDLIPVVSCKPDGTEDRLISDICALLYANLTPDVPFVACIASNGTWSLRSDKHGSDFDVSKIAEHYGGGGHKNSSGFRPS
jgi:uncharacterized protein